MAMKSRNSYALYTKGLANHLSGNDPKGIKEMQQAIADLLSSDEDIPEEIRHTLYVGFEMILRGEKHYLFSVAGNRPPVSYTAEKCRNDAVRYILSANEIGKKYDNNPIKTISKHYEVTTRTVNRWVALLANKDLKLIDALNNKEFIKKIMLSSALAYKKYSYKRGKSFKSY